MGAHLPARRHSRRALAIFAALSGVGAVIPGTASATVTGSTITSPANDTAFFVSTSQDTSGATAFTVSGTVTGSGAIDVVCVDINSGNAAVLASNVTPSSGAFSIPVSDQTIYAAVSSAPDPCVLRAMPTGVSGNGLVAGSSTPFAGPTVAPELEIVRGTGSATYNFFDTLYDLGGGGTTGAMWFDSAGSCGLDNSWLFTNTAALPESNAMFSCDGALFSPYKMNGTGAYIPDEVTVDGQNGAAADSFSGSSSLPGYLTPTFTDSNSNGALTIQDEEPLMLCASSCATGLPSRWNPAGVTLKRTWQTTNSGLVAVQTDVFSSTDGRAHTVTVLEDDELGENTTDPVAADFPGTSGFQAYTPGNSIAPQPGSGTIYLKDDKNTPDSGDPTGQWPQGAIVYTKAPTAPIVVTYWSLNSYPEFYLPYTLQIPAGGTAALRFAYVQDFALSDVKTLAQNALAGFDPSLSLSSPSSNATLSSPEVTVSGSASSVAGIESVTVNGTTATVGLSGGFSTPLTLPVGSNTITVVATDADGLTTTQTASVTVAKQTITSLGTALRRRTAKRFPYRYTVHGALTLPAGVSATQGCSGNVTLIVRHRHRRVLTTTAAVNAQCGWGATLKLARRKLVRGRHGKLTITASFGGNAALNPYAAGPVTVRYGH